MGAFHQPVHQCALWLGCALFTYLCSPTLSLSLQGCFARVPSAKPNIQTTTKSAGLAFKGDTLASCPARGARACSGKTAVSFNDDPKVALGGFGSSRCALGRLQLVHCRGLCARRWGRWCWECRVWTPVGPAKNLKMKMEEKVNNKRKSGKSWKSRFWESQLAFCARGGSIYFQSNPNFRSVVIEED